MTLLIIFILLAVCGVLVWKSSNSSNDTASTGGSSSNGTTGGDTPSTDTKV